jgi:hypothetical protein
MRGKLLFLAGAAAGYVLGSKAGRQAYEQIRTKAREVWGSPPVQKTVSQAGQVAKDAANLAQSKVSSVMDHATDAMEDASKSGTTTGTTSSSTSGTTSPSTTGTTSASTTGTTFGADGTNTTPDADSTPGTDSSPGTGSTPGSSSGGHG